MLLVILVFGKPIRKPPDQHLAPGTCFWDRPSPDWLPVWTKAPACAGQGYTAVLGARAARVKSLVYQRPTNGWWFFLHQILHFFIDGFLIGEWIWSILGGWYQPTPAPMQGWLQRSRRCQPPQDQHGISYDQRGSVWETKQNKSASFTLNPPSFVLCIRASKRWITTNRNHHLPGFGGPFSVAVFGQKLGNFGSRFNRRKQEKNDRKTLCLYLKEM